MPGDDLKSGLLEYTDRRRVVQIGAGSNGVGSGVAQRTVLDRGAVVDRPGEHELFLAVDG